MQKTALIVDDSRVARMTLKKLLVGYQFNVVESASGEEAIEYLESDGLRPDVIFMDVMMGGIDGLTATKQIKENPKLKAIPVVICTGNDTEEDRNKALGVGAITALTKPPVSEALDEIIKQLNSLVPSEPAAPAFDEDELVATILAVVEQKITPKIDRNVREVANDTTEKLVIDQVSLQIKEKERVLTRRAEDLAEQKAKQVSMLIAQEIAQKTATEAVQAIIEKMNIAEKVTQFLDVKGEEWLGDQEEDLGTQLSTQMDSLIPAIVNQNLENNLASIVAPIVEEKVVALEKNKKSSEPLTVDSVIKIVHTNIDGYTEKVVEPFVSDIVSQQLTAQTLLEKEDKEIHILSDQIALLKKMVIGLAVAVVGLLIAVIV